MPILHPRPGRTPLLVGLEWFAFHAPQLAGGGALITAGTLAADYGAPTAVSLPLGLLSAWPLGVVVRETVHSVRCWQLRQLHAEFLRASADQREPIYTPAERVTVAPAELPAEARPAELPPARSRVIEADVAETELRR